jgi:homoserine dehydrogenase
MKNKINIAVVGLGQVGIYLLNELNTKKKDIELKTGKKINIVAVSARNISKKRSFKVNKKIFFKNP